MPIRPALSGFMFRKEACPPWSVARGIRCALVVGVLGVMGRAGAGEKTIIPITSDTSISCYSSERDLNAGGAVRIKMKGIENVILLGFDAQKLKGKTVLSAVLHMQGAADDMMVRQVGISTVAVPWGEGKGNYTKAGKGEACFLYPGVGEASARPAQDSAEWAGPGSEFMDAVWGRSGTFWSTGASRHRKGDMYWVLVQGRMLEACAAGLSYGIAVSDDSGQTMNVNPGIYGSKMNQSNNYFFSREHETARPWIEAVTLPPRTAPPARKYTITVKPWPGGADFATGGVEISFPGPRDRNDQYAILGYRIAVGMNGGEMRPLPRWMHPSPVPGESVRVLVPGVPPGAEVAAEVEIVWRAGRTLAKIHGAGRASDKLSPPGPFIVPAPAANEVRDAQSMVVPAAGDVKIWAVPDGVKVNPVNGNVLEEPGVEYGGKRAGTYRTANAAWSGKEAAVILSALRGEWIAFQLACALNDARSALVRIVPGDLVGPAGSVIPASAIRLSRAWYQKVGDAWYADPLLPLGAGEEFSLPDKKNAVPGQTCQTVYAELFVPRDAATGEYTGRIAVDGGGKQADIGVRLTVHGPVLPPGTAFTWSLNAYESPGYGFGSPGSAGFLSGERAFYAMAHEHRATLAILHYSHRGECQEGTAPEVKGAGDAARVADWSEWDARFGPLFDGSAFKDTNRDGVPLDHFYLVLSESYPTSMADGYAWNFMRWEDHWLMAGTIEKGFAPQVQDRWVATARDYIKHIREKGWKTSFQVYLNDKYYYKRYDEKTKKYGKGVSFWLLDEPLHIADFLALRYFGNLLRKAQAGSSTADSTRPPGPGADGDRHTVIFRADVSGPQWGRDTLDRVVDLNVSGGFTGYRRLLEEWKERYGQKVWTYGTMPSSAESALGLSAQALDLYARGVDGYVPWLVLGSEESWGKFEPTCVLYTGKPFGITGPCASLRLKALRRAEQDVEYLRLLAVHRGLDRGDPNRKRIARLLEGILTADRKVGRLDAEGAVTESISGLTPELADGFRRAVALELESIK